MKPFTVQQSVKISVFPFADQPLLSERFLLELAAGISADDSFKLAICLGFSGDAWRSFEDTYRAQNRAVFEMLRTWSRQRVAQGDKDGRAKVEALGQALSAIKRGDLEERVNRLMNMASQAWFSV